MQNTEPKITVYLSFAMKFYPKTKCSKIDMVFFDKYTSLNSSLYAIKFNFLQKLDFNNKRKSQFCLCIYFCLL